ncbi:DEAD/DEAH box helicase [Candidatus Nomurabacteria bacterium]|nr:DEAD/DEAH box helicase [Candidatus Nomurabacteria bacterium]
MTTSSSHGHSARRQGVRSRGGFRSHSTSPRTATGSSSGRSHYGRSQHRGRSFGARRPKKRGDHIDEALFINRAVPKHEEVYAPKHAFADFAIPEKLKENLAAKGFVAPSPIQDQAIPVALEGKDVIGIAATGTGKTAAFLIPLITKLKEPKNRKRIMVLAPTRELAQQIETEFRALARGMSLWSVSCVGGSPILRQIRELDRGVHAIIGTPGRIKDLIERKKIRMEEFDAIVLDEADRMLDMGFIPDMRYILGLMPKERQSLFFSATLAPEIRRLCDDFLQQPVSISVKTRDTASSVEQDVVRVSDPHKKLDMLAEILSRPEVSKVLIFREMKRHVDDLAHELATRGFKALALHGDMRNRERDRAVKALASGDAHIVIATDVAARGIDIPDITHVINYDIPQTYDTYVHRIGRTGRGTKTGHALTFV